ncbi:universal stress protein UspA-like protein [Streptomyces noursei ATCC 11455]|uniref:universal stress protein n=1 Tax=Streptomyces noursei TaxID=1971 RepID=UPI00081D0937|nr:universal stress protein UspA-like protein [Streptomyces noursei ATCC 11455]
MSTMVKRVVVGVDGSRGSVAALRRGAQEAARHQALLCPVHAWAPPGGEAADAVQPAPADVRAHWERDADATLVRACQEAFGTVGNGARMLLRTVRAPAGMALVACAAGDTDVLVVGDGGHGPLHRLLHGSVSRYCLRHAHCPVLLVHSTDDAP